MRHNIITRTALCLAVALMTLMSSCKKQNEDSSFDLYYPGISDMGISMTYETGAPSFYGGKPSEFAITGVKLDGKSINSESFVIDTETGSIKVENTASLEVGIYHISVSCVSGGSRYTFKDIVQVELLPSVPATIEVSPSVVNMEYNDPSDRKTAQVTITSPTASVQSYQLVQESGKEYFAINNKGVISINSSFAGEIPPGSYPLTVRAITKAGQAVFADAVIINITSQPIAVTYTPNSGKMEYDMIFESASPVCKGSADQLTYAIKSITPSTDKITINPSTGKISVAAGNGLAVGGSYSVSITATNSFGTADFNDVFTLNVVNFINPISAFTYTAASKIQATAWTISPDAGIVGDEISYSIKSQSAQLNGKISISTTTGEISAVKGNTIPVGSYSVTVEATNVKGAVEATLPLTIVANPNYFTTINYGNNLGLTPTEDYASQFIFSSQNDINTNGEFTPTTDIPEGVAAEWSVKIIQYGSTSSVTINASTGKLKVTHYKADGTGLVFLVTAVTAKGTEAEVSVTVPVFVYYPLELGGLKVNYKPFVLKVNPRTGGSSVAPTVEGLAGGESFLMIFKRSFAYYNINGPASHIDGTPAINGSFLNKIWSNYYTAISGSINTGANNPIVEQYNTSRLSIMPCYVSSTDGHVVVNPNLWVDDSGNYANGVFTAQMVYTKDGLFNTANASANANKMIQMFIWFDEKF